MQDVIRVRVNDREVEVPVDVDLDRILQMVGIDPGAGGCALAMDGRVIPRGAWKDTRPEDRSVIEIVRAAQGG